MPDVPADYFLSGLGGLANLPDPFAEQQAGIQANQQNQLGQQAIQQNANILGAQQQKQQRDAEYQSDVQNALKTGQFGALYAKYPEQQKALQAAHDALDKPTQDADKRDLFAVSSYIKNGAIDAAKKVFQNRITADTAAGRDPKDDQDALDSLNSGDTARVKSVADMALYAILPEDKRAEVFGKSVKNGKVIGDYLVDDDGTVLFHAPKTEYKTVKNADGSESLVQVGGDDTGGGGQASSSGALASGALSVRLNNPGAIRDNPANKWQGQIGSENGFAKFDTPENGARAHKLLIANQIRAGFDTPAIWAQHYAPASDGNDPAAYAATVAKGLGIGVDDKIPLAAVPKMAALSAQVERGGTPAPATASATGGPKVLFTSKGASGDNVMSPEEIGFYAEKVANGADLPPLGMGKDAALVRRQILAKSADIQMNRGITAGQSNLLHSQLKANTTNLGALGKLQTFVNAAEDTASANADQVLHLAPQGVGGSVPIFNRWIQGGRKELKGDPIVSRFNLALDTLANEYAKVMTTNTGSGGVTSDAAFQRAHGLLNNSQTLDQLRGTIKQMKIDMGNRKAALARQNDILSGNISNAAGNVAPAGPAVPADIAAILKKYGH